MQSRENPKVWHSNESGVERAKEECQTRALEGVPLDILQLSANSVTSSVKLFFSFVFFFSPAVLSCIRMPAEDSGKMFV
jgi:hypothetical protein